MRQKRPRLWRIVRIRVRRFLARAERSTPVWALLIITPWGASLALHTVFLLVLGLYYYAYVGRVQPTSGLGFDSSFADQLVDDITSLDKGDKAGDSFSTLETPEPPSIAFEPSPDSNRINLPEMRPKMQVGPELRPVGASIPSNLGQAVGESDLLGMRVGPATAPFSGRQGEAKAKLVRKEGGTAESEKAVERGLDWLARHQNPDGSWSLDTLQRCAGDGCPEGPAEESDTAATGLALLPMLGAGMTHTEPGRYQNSMKRGLNWLLRTQHPTGEQWVGGGMMTRMYSHAIATMTLCEAYGISKDKRLRDPAQRAVNFIINSQNKFDGGWRYVPGAPGDTSVFGWQIFALRSARLAGLSVPKATLRRCRIYLDAAAADEEKVTYSYMPGRPNSAVMTAEALVGRQYLGWDRDYPALLQGTAFISAHLEESTDRNIYYWYYATQLLHNMQGKNWLKWNERVRDGLVSMQTTGKGCDRGSWDPLSPQPDLWGMKAGRLFTTSLSLLTLEVYYRYLPLYRDRGSPLEGTEDPANPAKPGEAPKPGPGEMPGGANGPDPARLPEGAKPAMEKDAAPKPGEKPRSPFSNEAPADAPAMNPPGARRGR